MSRSLASSLAWASWVVGVVVIGLGAASTEEGAWAISTVTLGGLAFGIVGLILALRAQHSIGWLFLGMQCSFGLSLLDVKGPEVVLIGAVLMLFPSGRLPSSRWWIAVSALTLAGILMVVDTFVVEDLGFVPLLLVSPVMALSAGRIVNDYRRVRDDTRRQLKWLVWVLILGWTLLAASILPYPLIGEAHQLAGLVLTVGSPLAIGFAIMRYRLYDVDRIISRTLSYTLLVVVLGLIYAGLVALVGTRFTDSLAVAASTLTVAAVFNPVRSRLQRVVDRRFNRVRYDAGRVMDEFAASLRDQLDPDGLIEGWLGAVAETMQPSRLGVWMRS